MAKTPLFIDVGNTALKCVRKLSDGEWEVVSRCTWDEKERLRESLGDHIPEQWLVGSVRSQWETHIRSVAAQADAEVHVVRVEDIPNTFLDYTTPQTLGIDRFLACLGAWSISQTNVLVVDAGTACTIDWMDREGVYQGGVIAPGLAVLQAGFKYQTPELPSVPDRTLPDDWPGKSTDDCMRWGILGSFKELVTGHLQHYIRRLSDHPKVWLTGGDADLLNELIQLESPLQVHDYLVFEGMEYGRKQGWFGA